MKAYWGSGGTAPCILELGTRWRWMVSFTRRPPYPQGKSPWYQLDRRLGGLQNRSGCGDEKFPAPAGTRNPGHPARSLALYRWAIPALLLLDFLVVSAGESETVCYRIQFVLQSYANSSFQRYEKKGKIVPVLNQVPRYEDIPHALLRIAPWRHMEV
jgi:hypothetical protein